MEMKKIVIFLTIIVLLALTVWYLKGDENKISHIYKGQNKNWVAQYEVNGTETFKNKKSTLSYKNDVKNVLMVSYKGNLSRINKAKHIEISYKSSAGGGVKSEDLDGQSTPKTFTLKSIGQNGAIENKDEVIEVVINLDGKIETLELKNINK